MQGWMEGEELRILGNIEMIWLCLSEENKKVSAVQS